MANSGRANTQQFAAVIFISKKYGILLPSRDLLRQFVWWPLTQAGRMPRFCWVLLVLCESCYQTL
jgi:hypothetical protein